MSVRREWRGVVTLETLARGPRPTLKGEVPVTARNLQARHDRSKGCARLPDGARAGIKGGWLATLHTYPSEMAWTAIWAWSICFLATILVSLVTKAHREEELRGLVHSLTERISSSDLPWYQRPATLAGIVLGLALLLNIVFW